jgi:hypothetical protein
MTDETREGEDAKVCSVNFEQLIASQGVLFDSAGSSMSATTAL